MSGASEDEVVAPAVETEGIMYEADDQSSSVDSFEKQLQQQEQELQSQLRQQEQEDEARKAAAAAILQQHQQQAAETATPVPAPVPTPVAAPVPTPVAAPEGWQQENHVSEDMAVDEISATNGMAEETSHTTNTVMDVTPALTDATPQPVKAPSSPVTVGVKRPSPCPTPKATENGKTEVAAEEKEPAAKQRKLDELAKLWASVTENPKDFQAWTMLLQHVDQQSDLESGREAYAAFFARYPYCYGYWKKFADLEKRKGTKESTLKVFEQGLSSIPLSVDLWVHYMDYITHTYLEAEEEQFVRQQFERAAQSCGLEFRSDKMWDAYINWETSNKRYQQVTAVYDRVLATPVSKYVQHWNKFQDHIKKHSASEVLTTEEFLALRRSLLSPEAAEAEADETPAVDEAPPGVEDDGTPASGDNSATVTAANEEENKNIQQLIITTREKVHQKNSEEVKLRWSYEDAIKRPYFHVKPLERSQLQAWRDYLEFESKHGSEERTRTLFERCLIAAALYEEFWMRYLHYLETLSSVTAEEMRGVYHRACTIHLKDKLKPHLSWATFEEEKGNASRSLELLTELQTRLPDALEPRLQAIALERRRGNLERAEDLFKESLSTLKENSSMFVAYANLLVKYTRFLSLFRQNCEKAVDVLQAAIEEKINCGMKSTEVEQQSLETLLWAVVERAMACNPPKFEVAAEALKTGMSSSQYPPRIRSVFGHRYNQFVAECGPTGVSVSESTKLLRDLQQELRQLESSQDENNEEPSIEKTEDGSADNTNTSDTRRDKRGKSSSHSSYNSSSDNKQQQQQQYQQQHPPPMNQGGPQHNGSMGSGGGGGYNQNQNGGSSYNNQQNYPPQQNTGVAPPHQPPQHPPPQGQQQQQQGYGGYNQNYQQQGYPPQQYQGWGYPQQQQGGYGYNQQGWAGYPNYYGQR